ncbi:UNVERIFIED_CONTAM: hypothetical protein Scaly_3102200 [Sesamum calycinum]|uniref:DUF4283 domain-containing protein n=1 Tax=Sesamum calycinum TaxID=2727403 RepID=A0AAW2JM25_9LAMI
MTLRQRKHSQIPVWIRLKHLPMEYWTDEGLSTVASGVGTPLYTDGITKECSRLDYARVCVMLDYNSTLPKHLVVISPVLRDGKEDPKRVDVEYEWLPQRCKQCCSLGHIASACPDNMKKKIAPPITIFVKKHLQSEVRSEVEAGVSTTNPTLASVPNTNATAPSRPGSERTENGHLGIEKQGPVIRGSMIRVASWNVRGLNGVDHQRAVEQLRIRLNFYTIGPGLRTILVRLGGYGWLGFHWRCLISVLYGDYDLIPRRDLWGVLRTLSAGILEEPWLVLGDFNAVIDDSEVCGRAADTIGTAMYEVVCKLKALKADFRRQRQRKGNLTENVKMAKSLFGGDKTGNSNAQTACQMRWMKHGDQNSKVFFRKINSARAKQRVFQITKATGEVLTGTQDVTQEFISYFQPLLGGTSPHRVVDLDFLRSDLKHTLTIDEANLLDAPVTQSDIKMHSLP